MNTRGLLLTIEAVALVGFVVAGFHLYGEARKHVRNPDRQWWGISLLWRPEEFTARGDRLRRRALAFWLVGLFVMILASLLRQ